MRLISYTIGGLEAASSRLRSFYLFNAASDYGIEVVRPQKYRESFRADLVQIQKIISYKIIFLILILRIKKIKVIYDIDDQPISRKQFAQYWLALLMSTVVTTDTNLRKSYWSNYIDSNKIKVIPDVADSDENILTIFAREGVNINSKKLFWVGYAANFHSVADIANYLIKSRSYSFVASIQRDQVDAMRNLYPNIEFIPWSEKVIRDKKNEAKYMVLNHDYMEEHKYKSENKMVLAILSGLIPIVSRTPAYESFAKNLKAEYLLFDGVENVAQTLEEIEKIDDKDFFENAIKFIRENYSKEVLLKRYVNEIIQRVG